MTRVESEPTSEASSSSKEVGVAAVRLADGRLVFVEGVPPDLPMGALARITLGGEELVCSVVIASPHVIWRDPAARCAAFVRLERVPESSVSAPAPPVEALFLAEHDAPDAETLAAMLALAATEHERLDT